VHSSGVDYATASCAALDPAWRIEWPEFFSSPIPVRAMMCPNISKYGNHFQRLSGDKAAPFQKSNIKASPISSRSWKSHGLLFQHHHSKSTTVRTCWPLQWHIMPQYFNLHASNLGYVCYRGEDHKDLVMARLCEEKESERSELMTISYIHFRHFHCPCSQFVYLVHCRFVSKFQLFSTS
jgi:hypothetical protein